MSDDNKLPLARAWHKSKEVLESAKADEMDLRKQVMDAFFDNPEKKGTQKTDLSDKAQLVLSRSASIKVNKDKYTEFAAELVQKGLIGDDKLIKLTPSVSASAFKHLPETDRIRYDEMFVHTLSSPALKVEVKSLD